MGTFKHPFQEDPEKPPVLQPPQPFTQGLVEVYTGDGKGKTTAAFGVALRAIGRGLRVHAILFMKGDADYGEFAVDGLLPNFTIERFGAPGLMDMNNPRPEDIAEARRALARAREVLESGTCDILILDEINVAVSWKLLSVDDVLDLIAKKPANVELILTGRYAHPKVVEAADLVTMMRHIKHPYEKGVLARAGIDY
ncbi:MAG TPA: cob(I)yrinic acid a,c-diamide adenosyltransferase [Chloroflexota bacterium]